MVLVSKWTAVTASILLLLSGPAACRTCNPNTHALVGNPPACLPLFLQQGAKLTSKEKQWGLFGVEIALSGNTLAVTSLKSDPQFQSGPVYIFERKNATWSQQGPPIATSGTATHVALSGDGNTLAISHINSPSDPVLVYKRNPAGGWDKSYRINSPTKAVFGSVLALSADGTTMAIGSYDVSGTGGVYMYSFDGSQWQSTGPKLVGVPHGSTITQGYEVALSASGNIVAVSGAGGLFKDNSEVALWVFKRTKSGAYKQMGGPLRDASGAAVQPASLALSADGRLLAAGLEGAPGGALLFIFRGSAWVQHGRKLLGSNAPSSWWQNQVALSGDGNTLALGVRTDNLFDGDHVGGAYVFVYVQDKWQQLGDAIVGKGAVSDQASQGFDVHLSAGGRILAVSGPFDGRGSVWMFKRART